VLRKEKPTEAGSRAYFALKADNKRLSLILRWLLEHKTKDAAKQYFANMAQIMGILKEKIKAKYGDYDERIAINFAIIAAGFYQFDYHTYNHEFINWVVDECIVSMQRKQSEDMLYKFISDIEIVFTDNMASYVKKTETMSGKYVYLCFDKIYNEWVRNQRQTGMQEYISKEGLKDYLKKENYWVPSKEREGDHRRYFFTSAGEKKQQRCICLNIELLPAKIKDVVDVWSIDVEPE